MILKLIKSLLISLIFIAVIFYVGNLKFTKVTCVSQIGNCNNQIIEDINSIDNFTFFSANKKFSDVLKRNIFVEKYSFQYILPSELVVHIIQKKPFYVIYDIKSTQYFLIDKFGTVLSVQNENNILPMQLDDFSYIPGQKVSDKHLFALKITASLSKTYSLKGSFFRNDLLIEVKKSANDPQHFLYDETNEDDKIIRNSITGKDVLEIVLENGIKVIFPTEGDLDYLTGSFVLMYNQLGRKDLELKIDNNNISLIDLRFKNPVLVLK